jgi:hypothetical protein
MKFKYDWSQDYPNTKVPKTVTFPDGHKEKTGYMRDGIILFSETSVSASYERDGDRCAEFMILETEEEHRDAINKYMGKQFVLEAHEEVVEADLDEIRKIYPDTPNIFEGEE